MPCRRTLVALAAINTFAAGAAGAGASERPLEELEVVGTPLGASVEASRVPANVQRASAASLRDQHALGVADAMRRRFAGVFVNEAQNNPLQPDVQYRGYVGSPLLGLPQGLAVYQGGVRVNEPFGDTVNWALIPESAIDTVYLVPGSNPLFGLNALGGAIAIETKDGFSHSGTRGEASAGSFGRVNLQIETGRQRDERFAWFVTAERFEEDGWRDYSPSEATSVFGNVGWRGERSAFDLSATLGDTELVGNGAAPVDLLAQDRAAIFTRPDITENTLRLFSLSGSQVFGDAFELAANAYWRRSDVDTYNGDDSDFEECELAPGFICEEEDEREALALDANGQPIAAAEALEGATVNRTATRQDGVGVGVQGIWRTQWHGREARLVFGAVHDSSDIDFAASTELGRLDATRQALPGGVFVGEAFTGIDAETGSTGVYVAGRYALTPRLDVTAAVRFNRNRITLRDRLGTALDGDHTFDRVNPSLGLTYAFSDAVQLHASYSESNRSPTPVELTCADPDDPCRLPNAFVADPPLEQVVAQTLELGLRGGGEALAWHAGVFGTVNEDDILFISAGALTNQGYFDNVGRTRRVGAELGASGSSERVNWFASYTWLDAEFRRSFSVPSHHHPLAVAGEIAVERGDALPLVPRQLLKAGATFSVTPRLRVGADVFASDGAYLRGDEANLLPRLDDYAVLSLTTDYALTSAARVYLRIENAFDTDYETFGTFGEPDEVLGDAYEDPQFLSPGMPRAAWVGVRVEL